MAESRWMLTRPNVQLARSILALLTAGALALVPSTATGLSVPAGPMGLWVGDGGGGVSTAQVICDGLMTGCAGAAVLSASACGSALFGLFTVCGTVGGGVAGGAWRVIITDCPWPPQVGGCSEVWHPGAGADVKASSGKDTACTKSHLDSSLCGESRCNKGSIGEWVACTWTAAISAAGEECITALAGGNVQSRVIAEAQGETTQCANTAVRPIGTGDGPCETLSLANLSPDLLSPFQAAIESGLLESFDAMTAHWPSSSEILSLLHSDMRRSVENMPLALDGQVAVCGQNVNPERLCDALLPSQTASASLPSCLEPCSSPDVGAAGVCLNPETVCLNSPLLTEQVCLDFLTPCSTPQVGLRQLCFDPMTHCLVSPFLPEPVCAPELD